MWRKHIQSWLLLKEKKWNGKVEIFIREGKVPKIKDTAIDQMRPTIPAKKFFRDITDKDRIYRYLDRNTFSQTTNIRRQDSNIRSILTSRKKYSRIL